MSYPLLRPRHGPQGLSSIAVLHVVCQWQFLQLQPPPQPFESRPQEILPTQSRRHCLRVPEVVGNTYHEFNRQYIIKQRTKRVKHTTRDH